MRPHLVVPVLVARLSEVEAAVVSSECPHARNHHLAKWRVHVKEEGPVDIPAGELAEVGLVPADMVRVIDPIQSRP